jgi:phenylacetic acid degradation operon negative regulatory protein
VIVVSNARNTDELSLWPLNARSLALSTLLGTHPPQLPGRALVALAELFGIPGGTMRTALSRMAANEEIVRVDSRYSLAGRLLDRQRAQDAGRRSPGSAWDGRWHTIVAVADQRQVADRRRFRSSMVDHHFGELRPDIWMRPTNLERPPPDAEWICTSGALVGIEAATLAARLWNLEALADEAHRSLDRLDQLWLSIDWDDKQAIPEAFVVSAAVLRFLRSDPLLPFELAPPGWPVDELRLGYEQFEAALQQLLRSFLSSV